MTINITLKAFTVWFGILALAITNGAIREALLNPELGKTSGFIISGLLLSIGIILVTYLTLPWIGKTSVKSYVLIGIGWLCITLLFEFSFGCLQGKPWSEIFDAYMFKDGNIWPVVLLVTALAPYLSARIRGWA